MLHYHDSQRFWDTAFVDLAWGRFSLLRVINWKNHKVSMSYSQPSSLWLNPFFALAEIKLIWIDLDHRFQFCTTQNPNNNRIRQLIGERQGSLYLSRCTITSKYLTSLGRNLVKNWKKKCSKFSFCAKTWNATTGIFCAGTQQMMIWI